MIRGIYPGIVNHRFYLIMLVVLTNIIFKPVSCLAEESSLVPSDFTMNQPIFEFQYKLGAFVNPYDGTVKIYKNYIINHAMTGESGDLRIAVYLTDKKYDSEDTISGCEIVNKNIGRLKAGERIKFDDIDLNIDQYPVAGKYYVTLLLEEYNKDDFYIVKDQVLDNTVDIPNSPVLKDKNQELKTFFVIVGAAASVINSSQESSEPEPSNVNIDTNNENIGNVDTNSLQSVQRTCDDLERAIDSLQDQLNSVSARHEEYMNQQKKDFAEGTISRIDPDSNAMQQILQLKRRIAEDKQLLARYKQRMRELS